MHLLLDILRSRQADEPFGFRFGHQEYIARTASGGVKMATLGWDNELLADLTALRRPQPDAAVTARVGDRLRKFLSELGFDDAKALIAQATTAGDRVTITMQLYAAELFALPWELFTLRVTGQHAGALPHVLFRYCWPESKTAAESPCPRPEGGRILVAWSAAGGPVPAAEHLTAIGQAAAFGHHPFSAERDVLSHVSMGRLRQALTPRAGEQPISVLHVLCHGIQLGSTFGLAWDADDHSGSGDAVDGIQLQQMLAPFAGHLRLIILCACDSGNSGELGNHLGSLAQSLHRAGFSTVIASRFPLSTRGSIVLTETLFQTLLAQSASLEDAFIAARQRLLEQASSLDWASLQLYANPADGEDTRPVVIRPYRGLEAFQPADQRLFFGRQAEVQQAISNLEALRQAGRPRFLVVAGASGSGKSSVVLGGLLPTLTRFRATELLSEKCRAAVQVLLAELGAERPGSRLQEALGSLRRALSAAPESDGAWEYVVMRPGTDPLAALTAALLQRRDSSRPFLLVVDQLEEIFTHTSELPVRQHFMQRLWTLAQANNLLSCVVTLRVDFLGQCAEIPLDELGLRLDRVAYDEAHRVFVAQMQAETLRMAIEGPARLVGLQLDEGLAAQMIADVQGEPGALPLLSYVLDLLWQRRVGRRLTMGVYRALDGAAGALSGNADRVYLGLSPIRQKLARRLLVLLVSRNELALGDSRRRVPEAELRVQVACSAADFDATVAAFVGARLLVRSEDNGQILEVAHEALLRKWQSLRDWLEENRQVLSELRQLDEWAKQYATFKSLLHGAQLGFAEQVLQNHHQDVGPKVTAMVEASIAARQRRLDVQQRRRRRNMALSLCAIGFLCGVSGYAVYSQNKIREQANVAASRMLTLRAKDAQRNSISQALLLAAHAMRIYDETESRSGLAEVLTFSGGLRTFLRKPPGSSQRPAQDAFSALAFSPGSDQVAAGDQDGKVYLYQVKTGGLLKQLDAPRDLRALAFSPDGRLLAAAGKGSRVALWDLTQSAPPTSLESGSDNITKLDFSPSGHWLAAAADRGRITAWNIGSPTRPAYTMVARETLITALRFFPGEGTRLAAGTGDGAVQLFDVATQKSQPELRGAKTSYVGTLAISPDGKWLVSGGHDEEAERWELASNPPQHTPLSKLLAADLFFRYDEHIVVTCAQDGSLLLHDILSGQAVSKPLPLHLGPVTSCVQSADGNTLALSTQEGIALWDLNTHPALHPRFQPLSAGGPVAHPDAPPPLLVSVVAVSPDENTLALGASDGSVSLLHIKGDGTFGRPRSVPGPQSARGNRVNGLVYRADGSEVISVGDDGVIGRIGTDPLARHRQVATVESELGRLTAVAYHQSKSQELLAIGAESGWLLLFELGSEPPRELRRTLISNAGDSIIEMRFSIDGTMLAAAVGATVSLRHTSDLSPIAPAQIQHTANTDVGSLDFSPDGLTLATGGSDKTIRLWKLTTQPPSADGNPIENEQEVLQVRFSPDGKLLATAISAQGIYLWSPNSKKEFGLPLVGHSGPIRTLVYGAKGLLLSTDDRTIWSWNIDPAGGIERACTRARRNLTKEEWNTNFPQRPYFCLCTALPAGSGAPSNAPGCKQ